MAVAEQICCPACGSADLNAVYKATLPLGDKDDTVGPQPFALAVCRRCNLTFQTTAYRAAYDEIMARAYSSYTVNSAFPFPDRGLKNSEPLAILLAHLPADKPLSLLEIGSNRGDLLYLLKEARPSYNVLGIEPTQFRDLQVPTINALFRADLFASQFDVVSLVHVLEHLKDPMTCLEHIKQLLRPGGWLYLEVPDLDLGLDNFVEDYIPDHVVYYSRATLLAMLGSAFEEVHCERTTFLRLMLRKRDESTGAQSVPPQGSADSVAQKFQRFASQKAKVAEQLVLAAKGRKLVFYGASYYFVRLYRELQDRLSDTTCQFMDDNLAGDHEPRFGLSRADGSTLQPDDIVMLASNNFRVQERMNAALQKQGCPARILMPWRGLFANCAEVKKFLAS